MMAWNWNLSCGLQLQHKAWKISISFVFAFLMKIEPFHF